MGYNTRYWMRALNPTTFEPVNPRDWGVAYLTSVVNSIDPEYGDCRWNPASGDLFGSEAVKWYDHEQDMIHHSLNHPQFIWAIRGLGENEDDEWVLYAYRGHAYKDKKEPWLPPPPNLNKLPPIVPIPVPSEPPDLKAVVEQFLMNPVHEPGCEAWEHPLGMDDGQCDCIVQQMRRAVAQET